FFFSSRRRHTRSKRDWSSDVCSSDLGGPPHVLHQLVHVFLGWYALHEPPGMFVFLLSEEMGIPLLLPGDTLVMAAGARDRSLLRSEERRVGKEWRARWGSTERRK